MKKCTYREAISQAIAEEMNQDETVFVMGEDVGIYGGGFGVTKGLLEQFGPKRVRQTPISESGFVGAGIGAAITGMRPVIELMFSDFIAVCYDQIVNQAAKMHYMFAGKVKVPMVIRTAAGAGTGAAAQHSQSLEQVLAHIPGLKVVVPSSPYDAKGLMKASIRDNNPVIFLEQKVLYNKEGLVPEEDYVIELGKADIKREGNDITVITYGSMVDLCLEIASECKEIDMEVIDLRTLSPLDTDTIFASVQKTGRVVIVHEAVQFAGFGAEIAAAITESDLFYRLKAPIARVGAQYCPIPFSPILEKEALPTKQKVLEAIEKTVSKR